MTDQEKREKVIKGLECCADSCRYGCPYNDIDQDCQGVLCMDALALLKSQRPDEDWISRKRLRDEIQYYIEEAGWGDDVNKVLGWCLEFIDSQEAVKWE